MGIPRMPQRRTLRERKPEIVGSRGTTVELGLAKQTILKVKNRSFKKGYVRSSPCRGHQALLR